MLAEGNSIPVAGMPATWREALRDGFDADEPDRLCALAILIDPDVQARGLSRTMLEHMRGLAHARGWELVAPVRPTLKHRYPLTPIERYVEWRREDGLLFDPWLRAHERLGAELLGIAPDSLVSEGTVAELEEWCGLELPGERQLRRRGRARPRRDRPRARPRRLPRAERLDAPPARPLENRSAACSVPGTNPEERSSMSLTKRSVPGRSARRGRRVRRRRSRRSRRTGTGSPRAAAAAAADRQHPQPTRRSTASPAAACRGWAGARQHSSRHGRFEVRIRGLVIAGTNNPAR